MKNKACRMTNMIINALVAIQTFSLSFVKNFHTKKRSVGEYFFFQNGDKNCRVGPIK